ncbi:hypothetical protein [Pelagibacterium montanilacus]|uniref:hypothetical protein n=1 Tax=Pelagibacterium montanilacus TaxID=2185280 RepID=UPI000F8F2F9C|nr:hypothetical protein [Pelagibacterium montanilacus]
MSVSALAIAAPGASLAMDHSLRLGTVVQSGVFGVSHDASDYDPQYGDPTSVLDFAPVQSMALELGLSGVWGAGSWYDLTARAGILSGGQFRDSDYYSGQVTFSDTLSDVALEGSFSLALRGADGGWGSWAVGSFQASPYVVGSLGYRQFDAVGLDCSVGCTQPDFSVFDDVVVITQDVFDVQAGPGIRLVQQIDADQRVEIHGEVMAGYRHVADSHHFRNDLGPTPNILFDFAVASASIDVAYMRQISEGAEISLGAFADGGLGYGQATFWAQSDEPVSGLPALNWQGNAGLRLGLGVAF